MKLKIQVNTAENDTFHTRTENGTNMHTITLCRPACVYVEINGRIYYFDTTGTRDSWNADSGIELKKKGEK